MWVDIRCWEMKSQDHTLIPNVELRNFVTFIQEVQKNEIIETFVNIKRTSFAFH